MHDEEEILLTKKTPIVRCAGIMFLLFLVLGTGVFVGKQLFSTKTIVETPETIAPEENKEIERKWVIDQSTIPYDLNEDAVEQYELRQSYINYSPEIRLRHIISAENSEFYTMTVKSDTSADGLTRTEYDWFIESSEYDQLILKQEGSTIEKTRYVVESNGRELQFDIFHSQLDGLAYLEIEFEDEETAKNFIQPDYVVKDVTADPRYKNQALSQFGIPKD